MKGMKMITNQNIEIILSGHENIVIWGGGAWGRMFYIDALAVPNVKNKVVVCDNDFDKAAQYSHNVRPKNIRELKGKTAVVICMKNHVAEVLEQLRQLEIDERSIYYFNPTDKEYIDAKRRRGYFNGQSYVKPLDDMKSVQLMKARIISGKEFLFSRWGFVEGDYIAGQMLGLPGSSSTLYALKNNAGVFPTGVEELNSLYAEYALAAKEIDLLCAWFTLHGEEVLFRHFSQKAALVTSVIEGPFCKECAWTKLLEGKTVLVVHPFAELIEQQYLKREYLWNDADEILPRFNLITYKAVQSMGGNSEFASWTEALHKMEEDIAKIDFDVALIGCGAYGMPLGAYIKRELHKQAIHLGGSLQLLFGIKGKRWEGEPHYLDRKYYNEYWVRPGDNLRPLNYKNVEDGCYW